PLSLSILTIRLFQNLALSPTLERPAIKVLKLILIISQPLNGPSTLDTPMLTQNLSLARMTATDFQWHLKVELARESVSSQQKNLRFVWTVFTSESNLQTQPTPLQKVL